MNMAIIHQKDKRSGITYAYESISYWDKEKKQSRAKRKLIGRVDEATGEIVPTDGRNRKAKQLKKETITMQEALPTELPARYFYGATYLLDQIGNDLGIVQDLKQIFPDNYKQILSIVYYLILEEHNPLQRFDRWGKLHKHPFGKNIPSQRSSELFSSITEGQRQKFFYLQGKRRSDKEYWFYDTTSISSYSQTLRQVQYGHNKEDDRLPQFNLALVYGEESSLPFYYRKLAGNIPDTKTLKSLLEDLFETLELDELKLIMDRGFFTVENINTLFQAEMTFLIAGKMSLNYFKDNLEPIYHHFRNFEHYHDGYELYHHTITTSWSYEEKQSDTNERITQKKNVYVHYYYNIDQAAEQEKSFDQKLMTWKQALEAGKRTSSHERNYKKYFDVNTDEENGTVVTVKPDMIQKAKKYFGYFCLMSNEAMDAVTALERYRNKDQVEKAFGNLKERLNFRRALVSSETSLDGKLFIEFIALIYLSHIKKRMEMAGLFKEYTLQGALDQLDVIESYESRDGQMRVGEILEKQKRLYNAFGIASPTSL